MCKDTHIDNDDSTKLDDTSNLLVSELRIIDDFADLIISLAKEEDFDVIHSGSIWRYLGSRLFKERHKFIIDRDELEKQKTDLEHQLLDIDPNSDECIQVLRCIGSIVLKRKTIKNVESYLQAASISTKRIGNFLVGMSDRKYTPRSEKYGSSIKQKSMCKK